MFKRIKLWFGVFSYLLEKDLLGVADLAEKGSPDQLGWTSEENAGPGYHEEDQGEKAKARGHFFFAVRAEND